MVYEAKVDEYLGFPEFLKEIRREETIRDAVRGYQLAKACGYRYMLMISDNLMYHDLIATGRLPNDPEWFFMSHTPGCLN